MTGLVYAFVARERTVLAEYSALAGNFRTVGLECLQNSQITDERFTLTADQYTFNYLVAGGYTYLVVADEAYGRQIPFAFLERIHDAFTEKYAERGRNAQENGLQAAFGPTIQRQLQYCVEHPEEISKMASVQRKVDEVKGIMMQNVEQVLVRGERLDVLVDRTDDLRDQAQRFQRQGTQLRKRMWWQNFRMKLIVVGVAVLLVIVIFLLACFTGGRSCLSSGHRGGAGGGAGAGGAGAGSGDAPSPPPGVLPLVPAPPGEGPGGEPPAAPPATPPPSDGKGP